MGIAVDSVPKLGELPGTTEVVVIGGGIIGVSAALTLAERGIPVVLCEKGHIAGEQSSRNWGWCRQMGRDPRELPLIVESLRLWRGMNARIGDETGFRQCGIVYLSLDEAALERRRQWLEYARPFQLDSHICSAEEIKALLPGLTTPIVGGMHTASDGRAEPQKAAPAMARAARARGATILQDCAVRGIEYEAGRVARVVTEKGAIACKAVILAGGAWSSAFLRNQGLRFPQLTTLSSVQRTAPLEGAPEVSSWGPGYAFRKRLDGGYSIAHGDFTVPDLVPDSFRYFLDFLPVMKMDWRSLRPRLGRRFFDEWQRRKRWRMDQVSPFEKVRTLDPKPLNWVNSQAMKHLVAAYPIFAKAQIVESWAGYIDAMPDVVPVISPVDGHDGLIIASGFSGHGFGIGPAAGELAADLATGAKPLVDPAAFRYSRFTDGSKPQPITGL